jgi:predicted RNA binding protein YcfA (HicA-like mRNA interferase family)
VAPRLRRLSGADIIRALRTVGFDVVNTRGSHAKLRRDSRGEAQILTVPLHKELAPGTVHSIFRQAARYVPEEELRPYFFSG